MFLKKFIGSRRFYRAVLGVAIPIMVQTGITNFVSLLDNIMVGQVGTESMSGVSIVNQFIFIFNLLIFGAISAAGIFTSQFHGYGDTDGVRHTFRFKLYINLMAGAAGILVFYFFGTDLIHLFLHEGAEGDLALTLAEGQKYLKVMLWGLIPYAISQVYASTVRETGDSLMPMIASVTAVVTNCILNLILIFGYLGAPALGVTGAAVATVISRFVELGILLIAVHTRQKKYPFIKGAFRSLRVPKTLMLRIAVKGLPLMVNEFFWSIAITMRNQCYSTRGLDVVAAQNIQSTLFNVFSVVYMAFGTAIAVVVGNQLGAGRFEEARDSARKMQALSVFFGILMGGVLCAVSAVFPLLYDTTPDVRALATQLIIISALNMPFNAYAHATYFTLRSGGKVFVTFLFDSAYMWAVVLPLAAGIAYLTELPILVLFAIAQWVEILKCIFGFLFLKRGTWVKQLVADEKLKS